MLLIKIARDDSSIMIPVYCWYTALYVLFFDELSEPAGNRLSQWPDIEKQGNLYPVYRYKFGNLSDEMILKK